MIRAMVREQVGINLFVLSPGEPIGMYQWEADQPSGGTAA